MNKIKQILKRNKIDFYENYDLSNLSSIKLGSVIDLVIFPKTTCEMEKLLLILFNSKVRFKVFGNLSNVLVFEKINYPVIITSKMNEELKIDGEAVEVSSGFLLPKFCEQLRKYNLSGWSYRL